MEFDMAILADPDTRIGYAPRHSEYRRYSDDSLRSLDIVAFILMTIMTLAPLAATGLLTP